MKFSGELKFPEIDHPGVPINFIIEGSQAELTVGGESLGRWSLYDVHARRLVASAFQIDLDGTEVTFVADDPIDFAYRGVEHMAESWAKIKSKGFATRSLAVRKSRKGTSPSRIEDMKAAMVSNLETVSEPRQIAGEVAMPEETAAPESTALAEDVSAPDAGVEAPTSPVAEPDIDPDVLAGEREQLAQEREQLAEERQKLAEERERLEEELQKLAEDRARFEEERQVAEQREADRIEAYRLEMKRLEAEREALSQRAEEMGAGDVIETATAGAGIVTGEEAEPAFTETEPDEEEATSEEVFEPEEPQLEEEPEPEPELEEPEPEPDEAEPEQEPDEEPEPAQEPDEAEPEQEPDEAEPEQEPDEEPEPEPGVVDLSDLEEEPEPPEPPPAEPEPVSPGPDGHKEPEPAMAGATRDRGGLMGAVRAAFRSGSRDHEHQFIEAPGGIGITRYVCEECGYVSISV